MLIETTNIARKLQFLAACLPPIEYSTNYSKTKISLDTPVMLRRKTSSLDTTGNQLFHAFLVEKGVLRLFIENVLRYNKRPFVSYSSIFMTAFDTADAVDEEMWGPISLAYYQ